VQPLFKETIHLILGQRNGFGVVSWATTIMKFLDVTLNFHEVAMFDNFNTDVYITRLGMFTDY